MHSLNLAMIALILVSLFLKMKFAYIISLLCSLAGATFIYSGVPLSNILLSIGIFSLIPLVGQRFSADLGQQKASVQDRVSAMKQRLEQLSKEHSFTQRSNDQLDKEVSQIVGLYKMMRDLSAVLGFAEIFGILGKKMTQSLHFKKARFILIDAEKGPLEIKKVYELTFTQPQAAPVEKEDLDTEILKHSFSHERLSYLEAKDLSIVPLMVDKRFLGALAVAGLPQAAWEDFAILINQFYLEFKRISLYQKVEELSITDGLTRLFARRYFIKRLQEEIERSQRHSLRLGFLMIDIDHFKQCNDQYGHLAGDAVLKEVAGVIQACVREIDLAARYGGEEFAVLLPDTDKEASLQVAERIRQAIEKRVFSAYNQTLKVKLSAGVAAFPEDAANSEDLIDQSDQALYRAKSQGRNKVVLA